jgi:hypothetical protein
MSLPASVCEALLFPIGASPTYKNGAFSASLSKAVFFVNIFLR